MDKSKNIESETTMPKKIWGMIHGNNLYRKAYISDETGMPDGEPWYIDENGTKWSAWDVQFIPDKK